MSLISKIQQTIRRNNLFPKGSTVVIGLSGGPDSVYLLHCLNQLQFELGIRLHAVHVNHRLRKESETDQKFVEKLAGQLHVPLTVVTLTPSRFPRNRSIEEAAREERFKALIKTAQKADAQIIALGHTQDDQAETVLMRIIRGTGLLGMQGILPSRKIGGKDFVRPLLDISKAEILAFLSKNKIPFRRDPSNRSPKFFRNTVRHRLLPVLQAQYNPNIRQTLAGLAGTAALDYGFLEITARKALQNTVTTFKRNEIVLDLRKLKKAHPSIRRLMLRMAIEQLKGDTRRLTLAHSAELDDLAASRPQGATVSLPGGISVRRTDASLILRRTR